MAEKNNGMLSPYRVLDLTEEHGFICGKVLGDLGADVIKIEKPGGDSGRCRGPFYQDTPHAERSLFWMGLNTSKRGITLDIDTADGREIFKRLCSGADAVVESFKPGYMDQIGLGYPVLSKINPGLIMASISGFGQIGPYKDFKAPELVVWALSGEGYVTGDADRPPLMPGFPIVYSFAALQAAIGIMVAIFHRAVTGEGQQVDASGQMSLAWTSGPEVQGLWAADKTIVKRSGGNWLRPRTSVGKEVTYITVPLIYACKDGGLKFFPFVEEGILPSTKGLTQWVIEEGFAGEALKKVEWRTWNWQVVSQEQTDELIADFRRFFLSHTKSELWEGAQKRGIQLYPIFTPEDIVNFPQLQIRNYWEQVQHPNLGAALTYPGAFVRSADNCCQIRRPAPLIGEHNDDIYFGELGISKQELQIFKQAGVI